MTLHPFVLNVLSLLQDFAPVRARRMFGGHGIYQVDLMFALVCNDVLYVKVDDANREVFLANGLNSFQSDCKRDLPDGVSYHAVPVEAMTDADVMRLWVQRGYDAAQRAADANRFKRRTPAG